MCRSLSGNTFSELHRDSPDWWTKFFIASFDYRNINVMTVFEPVESTFCKGSR